MNLWQRFSALSASRPILIATVIGSESWNRSIIEWPGGGQQAVSGGGTVGNRYFITRTEDGADWRLDGEAPDLPALNIEI